MLRIRKSYKKPHDVHDDDGGMPGHDNDDDEDDEDANDGSTLLLPLEKRMKMSVNMLVS